MSHQISRGWALTLQIYYLFCWISSILKSRKMFLFKVLVSLMGSLC
jgi:hypothetical protein